MSIPELTFYRKLTWPSARARSRSRQSAMSQFLAKVEAIRKALGLRPAEELPAPLAISDAMVLMGIKANESWALPERVEALVEALDLTGFGKSRAASSAKACSNHTRAYIGAISKGPGQAEDLRCCRATVCIKAAQALRCDGRRDKVAVQQEGARPGSCCAEGRRGHNLQ
jgi:hypothetical protein